MTAATESLLVITPAYGGSDPTLLQQSCTAVGIDLHMYGVSAVWPGFTQRVRDAVEVMRGRAESTILFTDASDTFIVDGAQPILAKFAETHCQFLHSAEKACWPDSSLAAGYPDNTPSPWKYINGGGWIGRRRYAIEYLLYLLDLYTRLDGRDDDQLMFNQCWIASPPGGVGIDSNCQIFQTMSQHNNGEIEWDGLRNTITGSYPSVFHFNGRTPGREAAYAAAVTSERITRVRP